jgi:hypothetical protein
MSKSPKKHHQVIHHLKSPGTLHVDNTPLRVRPGEIEQISVATGWEVANVEEMHGVASPTTRTDSLSLQRAEEPAHRGDVDDLLDAEDNVSVASSVVLTAEERIGYTPLDRNEVESYVQDHRLYTGEEHTAENTSLNSPDRLRPASAAPLSYNTLTQSDDDGVAQERPRPATVPGPGTNESNLFK